MYSRDSDVIKPTINGAAIATINANANSDAIDLGQYIEAIVFLPVTANTGTTPTLDCKIQYSPNYNPALPSAANWVDSGDTFTQITTVNATTFKKLTANFGRWVRLVFTVGGTNPVYTVVPHVVAKQ